MEKMRFNEILQDLLGEAKSNNNMIELHDVKKAFHGTCLSKEEYDKVIEVLEKENIDLIMIQDLDEVDKKEENPFIIDNLAAEPIEPDIEDSIKLYFKEIAQYPLLKEEEIMLAKKIEKGDVDARKK